MTEETPALIPADATTDAPGAGATFLVAFLVPVVLIVAVVLGYTFAGGSKDDTAAAGGAAAVTLTEFKIAPGMVTATTGGGIQVTNSGNVPHNLTIEGGKGTPDIEAGKNGKLDLSDVAPG